MHDEKKAAPREIVEEATKDNFHLVWTYIAWALKVGRFSLSPEATQAFHTIPREGTEATPSLACLNRWLNLYLASSPRRRIFSDIRQAQFEAAKRAVQITISEETLDVLLSRKAALFGEGRGSKEVTIRHLLEAETRSLPLDAFQKLERFRKRHGLASAGEAVQALVQHAEQASDSTLATRREVAGIKPLRQEIEHLLQELKERDA